MLSRYSVSQMFQADMVVMTHVEVFVIYWEDPGGGLGRPLLYSCPENPMDRGTWWAAVHRVAKSRT